MSNIICINLKSEEFRKLVEKTGGEEQEIKMVCNKWEVEHSEAGFNQLRDNAIAMGQLDKFNVLKARDELEAKWYVYPTVRYTMSKLINYHGTTAFVNQELLKDLSKFQDIENAIQEAAAEMEESDSALQAHQDMKDASLEHLIEKETVLLIWITTERTCL